MARWLLYGAYGFTGRRLIDEALRRGHQPVLAGRSAAKLAPLAAQFGLEQRAFALDSLSAITRNLRDIQLVFHAAGPHLFTAEPMMQACALVGAHYLDITGEIPVFESSHAYDEAARRQGVAVICGVGFDVVPSNCLARYVADQVAEPVELEMAIQGLTVISSGTARTAIVGGASGGWIRRGGRLIPYPLGAGARRIHLSSGEHTAMPVPWGDLSPAYHMTGIPNITAYFVVPHYLPPLARVTTPVGQVLLGIAPLRSVLKVAAGVLFSGPNEAQRTQRRAYLWAQASDDSGHRAQAWLETPEPYHFTALAGIRAVERTLSEHPVGVLAPAEAFGADFVLELDGVTRRDALPD